MISALDAAKGLYGAWRLAHGDRTGLSYFDTSVDGFWRSFGAAIVALPAYVGLVALSIAGHEGEVNYPGVAMVEAVAYTIDWFAFPLAAIYVAQWMGKRHNYIRLVVALNWARVLEATAMLPAMLVATFAPTGALALIPVAMFIAILTYHWWVIRVSLDVGGAEAALVTLVNLTIGVIIALWARTLLF